MIHCHCVIAEAVMAGQPCFFDLSNRYEALSAAGDPLERLATVVDFEVFRGPLVAALRRSPRGKVDASMISYSIVSLPRV